MADLYRFCHPSLDAQAKLINDNFCRWIGVSAGANQRRYLCRLCGGMVIARESAKGPMTRQAEKAILAHRQSHLD